MRPAQSVYLCIDKLPYRLDPVGRILKGGRPACLSTWFYLQTLIKGACLTTSDTTRSIVVIWVNIFRNELTVEIYSKSLVIAIGEVLPMKSS